MPQTEIKRDRLIASLKTPDTLSHTKPLSIKERNFCLKIAAVLEGSLKEYSLKTEPTYLYNMFDRDEDQNFPNFNFFSIFKTGIFSGLYRSLTPYNYIARKQTQKFIDTYYVGKDQDIALRIHKTPKYVYLNLVNLTLMEINKDGFKEKGFSIQEIKSNNSPK